MAELSHRALPERACASFEPKVGAFIEACIYTLLGVGGSYLCRALWGGVHAAGCKYLLFFPTLSLFWPLHPWAGLL